MSKEILCRIDPDGLWCAVENFNTIASVERYLTSHAVPEAQAPLIPGGVEDISEVISDILDITTKTSRDIATTLLDRFGIQWVDGAKYALVQQYAGDGSRIGMPEEIRRPTTTIEDQKKALIEKINSMTPEEFKEFNHE